MKKDLFSLHSIAVCMLMLLMPFISIAADTIGVNIPRVTVTMARNYNILNLPAKVVEKTGAAAADGVVKAEYLYSADGIKQRVVDATGSNGYLYLGTLVLSKSGESYALSSTEFGGGRIIGAANNSCLAYYYGTDHLGSVRVITDGSGSVVERNDYYPLGMRTATDNSYPQLTANLYKYNGKEVQTIGGLGFTDYGARMYDDFTGRWFVPDPLAEKYASMSPYMYCSGNPIMYVDTDGRFPIIPFIVAYYGAAKFMEQNGLNSRSREIDYIMQHPINALIVGPARDGTDCGNISTIASNFAINISKEAQLRTEKIGDRRNALRHVIWQSIITRRFGEKHAARIANAHEDNPYVDLNARWFNDFEKADQTVDLLNNIIGREIGKKNPNASNRDLARKVIEEFYQNGLWITTGSSETNITIKKVTITEEQYKTALESIDKKNEKGKSIN